MNLFGDELDNHTPMMRQYLAIKAAELLINDAHARPEITDFSGKGRRGVRLQPAIVTKPGKSPIRLRHYRINYS